MRKRDIRKVELHLVQNGRMFRKILNVRCVQWVKISFPKNKFSDEKPHYRGVFLLDFFSIDQYMSDYTGQLKRTAVCNDDIGVFSFFQGTDTVSDADVFCRVDGYGAERVILVHSGFDGETCAERQVLHLIP